MMIIGTTGYCNFHHKTVISFRSVTFKLFNLFEWLNIKGLKHDFSKIKTEFSLNYSKPDKIEFEYFEECKGSIELFSSISLEDINNKVEILEECSVVLQYPAKRSFRDILMDIYVFSGFATLCTFEQSYATSINFSDTDFTKESKMKTISCYYQNPTYSQKHKNRRKGEHLISYSIIKDDFPELIKNWYQKHKEIKPVFSLMLYTFRDKLKFSEDKFMDVVRAVETFHRRTQNRTKLPLTDFESKLKSILDKVEEGDKKWLQDNLEYANELSLKNRLKDLIKDNSNSFLQTRIKDINRFTFDVVNSRNYYTHYSADKEKLALRGKDLFELNQILLGLLISCVFKHIGLRDNLLDAGLTKSLQ